MDYNEIFSSLSSSNSLFSLLYSGKLLENEDLVAANHSYIMGRYDLKNKTLRGLVTLSSSDDEDGKTMKIKSDEKYLTEQEENYVNFIEKLKPTQYIEVNKYFCYRKMDNSSLLYLAELNYEKLISNSKDYTNMTDNNIQSLLKQQKHRELTSMEELQIDKLFEFIKMIKSSNFEEKFRSGMNLGFEYIQRFTIKNFKLSELLPLTNPSFWINDSIIMFMFDLFNFRQYLLRHRYNFDKIIYFENPAVVINLKHQDINNKMADEDISTFNYEKTYYKFCYFDLFSKMFWPLNIKNNHWTLMEMDFVNKSCTYYDSISSFVKKYANFFFTLMKKFLLHHSEQFEKEYHESDWKFIIAENVPQQGDGCNCGICLLLNADHLSDGLELDYECSKKSFTYYRKRYALHLLNGTLDYDLVKAFHRGENLDTINRGSVVVNLDVQKLIRHSPNDLKNLIQREYNLIKHSKTFNGIHQYQKLTKRGVIYSFIYILKFK